MATPEEKNLEALDQVWKSMRRQVELYQPLVNINSNSVTSQLLESSEGSTPQPEVIQLSYLACFDATVRLRDMTAG